MYVCMHVCMYVCVYVCMYVLGYGYKVDCLDLCILFPRIVVAATSSSSLDSLSYR